MYLVQPQPELSTNSPFTLAWNRYEPVHGRVLQNGSASVYTSHHNRCVYHTCNLIPSWQLLLWLFHSFITAWVKFKGISVPRPIGLPHTVSETTGNEIPTRPYTLPLFLKHTSCWENYTFCAEQIHLERFGVCSGTVIMPSVNGLLDFQNLADSQQ